MNLYDFVAGRNRASLRDLIKAAENDNARCRARIQRNEAVRASCQLATLRQELEEDERE